MRAVLAILLSSLLAGCGADGPPEPYPGRDDAARTIGVSGRL